MGKVSNQSINGIGWVVEGIEIGVGVGKIIMIGVNRGKME